MAECCPPVLSSSGSRYPALCLPQHCYSGSGMLIQHLLGLGIRTGQCWSPPHIHRIQRSCPKPPALSVLMSWPWEMKGWSTPKLQEPPQLRDGEHLPPKVMFPRGRPRSKKGRTSAAPRGHQRNRSPPYFARGPVTPSPW